MKNYLKLLTILFAVLIGGFITARAQTADYAFVVFETTVTREGAKTSDSNPEERRFYVSNIVTFAESDPSVFRNAAKEADEYFTAGIVEPLKAKGILHQYYDDGIRINNKVVYDLKTRAEVEDLREKTLQELQEQNVNIFTFRWTRDGKIDGLETTRPTLFYHEPDKPLYGANEMIFSSSTIQLPITESVKKRPRKN